MLFSSCRFLLAAGLLAAAVQAQDLPAPAGPLEIQLTTGTTLSLESFRDSVAGVLLVDAANCGDCDAAAQTLGAVQAQLAAQGLQVVAVAVDTGADPQGFAASVQAFAARVGVSYPVGSLSAEQAAGLVGREDAFVGRTPTVLPDLIVLGRGLIVWEEHPSGSGGRGRGDSGSGSELWSNPEANMRAAFEQRLAAGAGPVLFGGGVLNAASFEPAAALGAIVSIFGVGFADSLSVAESSPLPTDIAGVQVTLDGEPLPLFFVSPGQINVQLPFALSNDPGRGRSRVAQGTNGLVVTTAAGQSNALTPSLTSSSAAIYTANQSGSGQGIVVFANTTILAAPRGVTADSRPAKAGDALSVFANALGPVDPPIEAGRNSCDPDGQCQADFSNLALRRSVTPPVIRLGGLGGFNVPAENVLFSGLAPQFAGLYQVNFIVPEGAPAGDAVPIDLLIGRQQMRSEGSGVTIAIE